MKGEYRHEDQMKRSTRQTDRHTESIRPSTPSRAALVILIPQPWPWPWRQQLWPTVIHSTACHNSWQWILQLSWSLHTSPQKTLSTLVTCSQNTSNLSHHQQLYFFHNPGFMWATYKSPSLYVQLINSGTQTKLPYIGPASFPHLPCLHWLPH